MTTSAVPALDPVAVGTRTVDSVPSEDVAASCDVCGHRLDKHDRIARRYCDATIAHAISRSCICG